MRKSYFVNILAGVFLLFVYGQCTYHVDYNDPPIIITEDVSFQDDIIPIFDASCNTVGCHAVNGIAPDLTPLNAFDALFEGNYIDTIAPDNSELYQWMLGNRGLSMPISGPDADYNALVLEWITQGAKNN